MFPKQACIRKLGRIIWISADAGSRQVASVTLFFCGLFRSAFTLCGHIRHTTVQRDIRRFLEDGFVRTDS